MAHKITKYQCDFCRKSFASKSYAEKQHEPVCFYNPARKSCITCNNFSDSFHDGIEVYWSSCIVGKNISEKLKVECSLHKPI